jgi:hypothetical protein
LLFESEKGLPILKRLRMRICAGKQNADSRAIELPTDYRGGKMAYRPKKTRKKYKESSTIEFT